MTQLEAVEVVAGLIATARNQVATVRRVRDRGDVPDGTIEIVMSDAATGARRGTGVFPPGSLDAVADEDLRDLLSAKIPWEAPLVANVTPSARAPVAVVVDGQTHKIPGQHLLLFTDAEVRALLRAGSSVANRTPHLTSALDKLWEAE